MKTKPLPPYHHYQGAKPLSGLVRTNPRSKLPLLLAQLGVTLFWVHDRSPGQAKTGALIDGAVPLVDRLVGLARYRVLRPAVRDALKLYRTLRD